METMQPYLPYLIPLVLVQLALQVLSLLQLLRPETRVRGGSKLIWGIVILAFQLMGVLVYHLAGKLPPNGSDED